MDYSDSRFGSHQAPSDRVLDAKHSSLVDEDGSAVLDPSILDSDIMQSPTAFRKDSLANSNGVLSPAESQAWDQQYNGTLNMDSISAGASHPFHDDSGAAYGRQTVPHTTTTSFAPHQHPQAWSFESGSGDCTPTNGVDFIQPTASFEPGQYPHHRNDSVHTGFSQPQPPPQASYNGPHAEGGFIPAPQVQTPMSPHSHQDWMGLVQQEMEGRIGHKRMRPNSPPLPIIDFRRGDGGIRKKNGRIDIPQERNINTIDELIEKETDEEVLKELKQQKRLLRNREAALASRQRKKKHTEDLEIKEKSYTQQISLLENKVSELSLERERFQHEHQLVFQQLQEAQRFIESLQEEVRDTKRKNAEETSVLRKRVQILTEQIESGGAPIMSTVPSSTGFADCYAGMEALNMGPHDWDNFIFVNDLQNDAHDDVTFDSKPNFRSKTPVVEKKAQTAAIVPAAAKPNYDNASEQPVTASGLLFMLLLCGAFVASKPASSQPPDMPKMPDDVRAAAPMVLNNLLAEPAASSGRAVDQTMARIGNEPMHSALPYGTPPGGRLDRMHNSLTTPSKQQEMEQAFSLSTSQYASIANMDYSGYGSQAPPRPDEDAVPRRRNLAQMLANMEHESSRDSKAEIYTRSLLWGQIPSDVVKQFREIVHDHREIEARQH